MSTRNRTRHRDRDRDQPEAPHRDPFDDDPARPPRTWWERHSITVMAVFSLVMLVFVITFQMSC